MKKLLKKIDALRSKSQCVNLSFDFDWLTNATTDMDMALISLIDNFTESNLQDFKALCRNMATE